MSNIIFPSGGEQEALLDAVALHLRDMTVGFIKVGLHAGEEAAEPAGTGTLVAIGSRLGIVTAAHVLVNLPKEGEVGLVRFRNKPDDFQRGTFNVKLAEKLTIGAPPFGPRGPDLGFLHLPDETVGSLKVSNVFFDAVRRRGAMLAAPNTAPYFDAVIGVLAEMTTMLPAIRPNTLRIGVEARIWLGNVVRRYESSGLDLFDFKIEFDDGVRPPGSYEGVSGGAVWRVYLGPDLTTVIDKRILGVAFYQSPPVQGERIITCQGPRAIYQNLIDRVPQ